MTLTKLPKGLTWRSNCEVYFKGDYLGRVQPDREINWETLPTSWFVWAPGDRAEGIAETKELGMMVLYVNWLATSRRLEGGAAEGIQNEIA